MLMHEHVMAETNDSANAGIKYLDRFESMLKRPQTILFGEESFPSILEKACVYFHSISNDHIFINGNKRTAAYVFLTYLDLHDLVLHKDIDEFEDYVLQITVEEKYKTNDAISFIVEDLKQFVGEVNIHLHWMFEDDD